MKGYPQAQSERRSSQRFGRWKATRTGAVALSPWIRRIACRDEDEHQLVKKVAEAKIGAGARVLRDKLYPIKVDSVNKAAVLDEKDEIRAEAAAAFSEENEATVAKIAWLSRKDSAKAYGSMVVYLTKGTDARRLLADGFFHAGGKSGVTSTFEYRPRPMQCYNCQELDTRHSSARTTRSAPSAPRGATATVAAIRRFRSAFHAGGLMNRSAEIVGNSIHHDMNKTIRIIQLNVRKQGAVSNHRAAYRARSYMVPCPS